MERNTVILPLDEYNQMRDFIYAIKEHNVVIESTFQDVSTVTYCSNSELPAKLMEDNTVLNEKIIDLKQRIDHMNDQIDDCKGKLRRVEHNYGISKTSLDIADRSNVEFRVAIVEFKATIRALRARRWWWQRKR